jgi:DnaJ-class molecular chaperone
MVARMVCPSCDGDGFDSRYVESCPRCKGAGKVPVQRYCMPCDTWVPASQKVCKACGADTDKAA